MASRRQPRRRSGIARAFKVLLVVALLAGGVLAAKPVWNHFNPEDPELTVRYRTQTKAEADAVRPWLEVFNTSEKPVPLSEVSLRYYFTADGDASYAFNCVEAAVGCSNLTGSVVAMDTPSEEADHYLQLGFTEKAGVLKPGANSRGLEIQLYRTDHKPVRQDGDWSFDDTKRTYQNSDRVPAYKRGALVWGKEPGGEGGEASAKPVSKAVPELPEGAFFDDFHYRGPKDTALFKHGWLVRTSKGGPGIENTWTAKGVSFPGDKETPGGQVLNLRAATDGSTAGTEQSALGTKEAKFRTGTYAARVHFTDRPTTGENGDHVNQTFFTIGGSGSRYAELDIEYMPNGGWGAPGPKADTTTWRNADEGDRVTSKTERSLAGWHTMVITVKKDSVTYSLDGKTLYRSGADYAPRAAMAVNFNTWFVDLPFTGDRAWDMKVDWFYHQSGKVLTAEQAEAAAEEFQGDGVGWFDTMPSDS
ncbi:Cellulose binding domain-containing protein [Streptomyces sp. DI166]|uniref:cellulose binding domain-containing protein n=1 Tax=Streptomyces sp. DI166 TaxID=1839783 RepID=UPI0007F3804E|nr:cellulose binding domain-containing protein [Streptomyces sp. DI166]SBT90674.1 Cellulose binding domain-containing protein [Streptomyces sp. DI166]